MTALILLTNDDGVLSPGLRAAAEVVADLGELLIVGPRFQQTAMGRAHPVGGTTGKIESLALNIGGKSHSAYGVHGSPALAVAHAVLELAPRIPDLCISGINYGENLGRNILVSGTVGAAFEASSYDIPAVAVSREMDLSKQYSNQYDSVDWEAAIHITRQFVQQVLSADWSANVALWNINIPESATFDTAMRLTRLSMQNYYEYVRPPERNLQDGCDLEWQIKINRETLEPDSDVQAFKVDRVVSITPLTWNFTADDLLGEHD